MRMHRACTATRGVSFVVCLSTVCSGISISKIESRPASAVGDRLQRAYHWDYIFYMDLELQARYGGKLYRYRQLCQLSLQ